MKTKPQIQFLAIVGIYVIINLIFRQDEIRRAILQSEF